VIQPGLSLCRVAAMVCGVTADNVADPASGQS